MAANPFTPPAAPLEFPAPLAEATGASTQNPAFTPVVLTAAVIVALSLHYVLFRFFVKRMIVRKILGRE